MPWSWKCESAREDHRNDKVCYVYRSRLCVRVGFVDDGADPSALRTDSISDGRDRHGPFKSLEDLQRVPHMGDMPWGELDEVKTHLTLRIDGEAPVSARLGSARGDGR